MSILNKIKRGDGSQPLRILLAGPEGIGKSTFGSKAPNPIFVTAEDGLTGLDHVQRFTPASLEELHKFTDQLITDDHKFLTLVVDTTDWLERLITASMCERDKKADIEDYGYGKGYVLLETELVKVLQKLDLLRTKRGMGIILLAHVQIRTFNDPRGTTYDRYEMKGHKRFTGILREWPDANLFAIYEVFKKKEKGEQRETAIGGERVIHSTWSPAWDAKNRLNLPPEESIPLDWDAFMAAVTANSVPAMRERVKKLFATARLSDSEKATWQKAMAKLDSLTADKLQSAIQKLEEMQN